MIKARVVIRDGYYGIQMIGHGNSENCAAASMMMAAAALGLRDLAKQSPRDVDFEADVDVRHAPGWRSIDSRDRRKK